MENLACKNDLVEVTLSHLGLVCGYRLARPFPAKGACASPGTLSDIAGARATLKAWAKYGKGRPEPEFVSEARATIQVYEAVAGLGTTPHTHPTGPLGGASSMTGSTRALGAVDPSSISSEGALGMPGSTSTSGGLGLSAFSADAGHNMPEPMSNFGDLTPCPAEDTPRMPYPSGNPGLRAYHPAPSQLRTVGGPLVSDATTPFFPPPRDQSTPYFGGAASVSQNTFLPPQTHYNRRPTHERPGDPQCRRVPLFTTTDPSRQKSQRPRFASVGIGP